MSGFNEEDSDLEEEGSVERDEKESKRKDYLGKPVLRETTFSVYSINLENTLKLLTNQKSINIVDKKDPRSKRMFISTSILAMNPKMMNITKITEELKLAKIGLFPKKLFLNYKILDKQSKNGLLSSMK